MIGIGDGNQGRKMTNNVTFLSSRSHPVRITNITREDFDALFYPGGGLIQPAPGAERIVSHERSHIGAQSDELLHEMRPDKAGGTGDKHFFSRNVHLDLT
jgi:hypothetical protein